MIFSTVKSGLVLLVCVQYIAALNTAELDQFQQGNGYNQTVKITDNNDGTLTFSVYKACRDRATDEPVSPRTTTPSILQTAPTDETPLLPGVPDNTPNLPEKLVGGNCVDRELSLTVKSSAVAIQAPAQPAPLPEHHIVGMALDGRPILQAKSRCRGKKRGGKRSGVEGGRRRGRGGRRGGERGRRDADGARDAKHEERRAVLEAQDQLLGVALDGFPIYSANSSDVADRLLQTSDLDQCGGRCDSNGNYRYHAVQVGEDDEARVVIRLGCIKGEMVESALSGLKPGRRGDDVDDDDDDQEGSGEDDAEDEDDEKKYAISCDADISVGSCISSATVSEDSYKCLEVGSSDSSDNDEDDDDDDDEEGSSEADVASNRRTEIRRRIEQAAAAANERRSKIKQRIQQASESADAEDNDEGSAIGSGSEEEASTSESDSDSSSKRRNQGRRQFQSRLSLRGRNGRGRS